MIDSAEDAFKRILRIFNVSDQPEAVVRQKLSRAGYAQSSIDDAVNRALSCHLVDDERYARVYVASKLRAGKGIYGIQRDLRHVGIDVGEIEDAEVAELIANSAEIEIDRAIQLLNHRPSRSKNARQGAISKLIRNGYSSSIASIAFRQWLEQNEN